VETLRKLLRTRAVRRAAFLVGALAVLAVVLARLNLQPNLAGVKVAVVVSNGCARRSTTTGLLTLLARQFPDLLRRNQDTVNSTGLPLAAASQQFFEGGGPDFATQLVPWAVDVMPFSNWVYAVTAVSVLFNLMGLWGRFRLSRIDAQRVKAEGRLAALFRPGITAADIARVAPSPEHCAVRHRAEVTDLVDTLEALRERCRQESRSWAADMGQEMPYRYQEHLMAELLDGLRSFRARVDEQAGDAASSPTGFAEGPSPRQMDIPPAADERR
jgi:hypothetical protein